MKGSSRSTMKEDSASAAKSRIGTRSTGRLNLSSSRSPRTVKSASSSPRTPIARTSRSISPGSPLLNLRTKRARLEKGKETVKTPKPVDTTPKHEEVPSTENSQSGSQNSQSSQGSQSSQNTPKGAGIRTRLSTGSIHMNGTMTISAAKEKAEMDQIMKQIAKTDNSTTTKTPTSVGKKRAAVPVVVSQEAVLMSDHPPPKKRKIGRNDGSGEDNCNDYFCWLCHKEGTLVCCELCPRVYHTRCLGLSAALPQDWVCPECEKIMRAECVDTRSKAMEMLTIDQLCVLLKYALERMKHAGSEPFQKPVDLNAVPNYFDYIFHPMDLSTLEKNIKKKLYGCTEALLADAKWILHNCIIYNGAHSKLTSSAKMIIKICKHEMNEIELCPDCYLNSCVRKNDEWFSETCRVPHTLVWAKLKGYPFWPSKALREVDGQVDVRFFGAHDRSWVPVSQCFLLSKNIPTSLQRGKKNNGLDMAIEELNLHVNKLRERFGSFEYAPFRTPYDKTDSYKPISQKPDLPSKTTSVLKLNQNRDVKSGNSSSLTSLKPNILRKSAVAKIRNKYSAMVSLKKIDTSMSPDKTKRKTEEDGKKMKVEENCEKSVKMPESVKNEISKEPISNENKVENSDTARVPGDIVQIDDQTKGKVIKKSFVSSNLIERIESKLKALEDEPEKEIMSAESVEGASDTNILAVNASNTAKLLEKERIVQNAEKSTMKETEKVIDKTEKEKNELKSAESLVKDKALDHLSEVRKEVTATTEENTNQNSEKKLEETKSLQISQDRVAENKEPDKSFASVSSQDKDSKDSYRQKLDTMIKSCKEKLGMDNEEAAEIDSALSDDGEDVGSSDEEDESGNEDASESEDEDNSEESKEMEDTGTESGSVDTKKDGKNEDENSKLDSSCEGNNDGKGNDETSEQDKCVTVSKSTTNSDAMSKRNENEVESNILTSKSAPATDSEIADHNQDKLTEKKSTAVNGKKSDEITVVSVNSDRTLHFEKTKKEINPALTEKKIQSATPNVSTNSSNEHQNAAVQAECKTTAHTEKRTTSLLTVERVKNNESFSGALSDRTSVDEDSDTDRLVIDLEETSPKKQSKIEKKAESRTKSASKCDNVVEKMKIRKELDKIVKSVQNCSADSKNKIECTTGHDKVCEESTAESETQTGKSISSDGKKSSKEVVESLSTKCRRESKESESSTQSKTSPEKDQSLELTDTGKLSGDLTKSKVPASMSQNEESKGKSKCKTHVKQLGDTDLPKESTGKSPVKESVDVNKSNEDMEVVDEDEDNVEILDDLSTLPLDSDLPVNTNSSLPDKNFVKPPCINISEEVQTGSKLAEKFSQKLLKTIQETMDEMYAEVMKEKNDGKTIEMLNKTLGQAKWDYCQELNELKHNFQLTMFEMKAGWESEKEQIVKALNAKHQAEKELAIKETKKKQWCAQCGKEAIFYCCWNTSYCDYPCQQSHWPQHMHTCLQTNKDKTASTTTSGSQAGTQSQTVSQSTASIQASVGPSVTPQSSSTATTPSAEPDHLRQLQDNISRAIHREEEKRGETRQGVSPKFSTPMSSPVMQNIRQPGSGQMMFNMQPPTQPGVMQQLQRTRFMGQQMAMQVQQRASLPQSQQGNPRMLFSQPLIQHAVYPLQVQQPQPIGGTILFQNAQQMSYGMPPRPY